MHCITKRVKTFDSYKVLCSSFVQSLKLNVTGTWNIFTALSPWASAGYLSYTDSLNLAREPYALTAKVNTNSIKDILTNSKRKYSNAHTENLSADKYLSIFSRQMSSLASLLFIIFFYLTRIGPWFCSTSMDKRSRTKATPTNDFPVPGGPYYNGY